MGIGERAKHRCPAGQSPTVGTLLFYHQKENRPPLTVRTAHQVFFIYPHLTTAHFTVTHNAPPPHVSLISYSLLLRTVFGCAAPRHILFFAAYRICPLFLRLSHFLIVAIHFYRHIGKMRHGSIYGYVGGRAAVRFAHKNFAMIRNCPARICLLPLTSCVPFTPCNATASAFVCCH